VSESRSNIVATQGFPVGERRRALWREHAAV